MDYDFYRSFSYVFHPVPKSLITEVHLKRYILWLTEKSLGLFLEFSK